ncbi:hypothetical protein Tsubulata_043107 [Turnera subulata]|uniref:CRAL-TRIO domain-containing protein n=1 Tax=Turnera subulata TaxID=218843 RepID=A0A9Q0F8X2_9ROSI|nr:hypothetical protein Tsubulata_043107 [Turnera subulata]
MSAEAERETISKPTGEEIEGKSLKDNGNQAKDHTYKLVLKKRGSSRKKIRYRSQQIYPKNNLESVILEESRVQGESKNQEGEGEGAVPVITPKEMEMRKKKALSKFKCMVENAIVESFLVEKPRKSLSKKDVQKVRQQQKEISLWGVPLLPSKGHECTDTVLLKFLVANDFRVHDAFEMLRSTLKWRREHKIDGILEEEVEPDLEKVVYINSVGKNGQPLYYNVYAAFKDKELYDRVFGTEESQEKYLRWRIRFLEQCIKHLSFKPGEPNSILQVTDLRNSPGPEMKEFRSCAEKAFMHMKSYYPEIIEKTIIINVPFWYYTSHFLTSKLISKSTKRKLILVRPSKVSQTLLKYISPENLPAEYGGLKRENDAEFSPEDEVLETSVRPSSTGCIKIPVPEAGVTVLWDLTVVGWDVTRKEEFVPDDEGSYRVLLAKEYRKMGESVSNSFYISEPGNIVINIENASLKKKRVYYRYKSKPTTPAYFLNQQT